MFHCTVNSRTTCHFSLPLNRSCFLLFTLSWRPLTFASSLWVSHFMWSKLLSGLTFPALHTGDLSTIADYNKLIRDLWARLCSPLPSHYSSPTSSSTSERQHSQPLWNLLGEFTISLSTIPNMNTHTHTHTHTRTYKHRYKMSDLMGQKVTWNCFILICYLFNIHLKSATFIQVHYLSKR